MTRKKNGRPKPYIQRMRELVGLSQKEAATLSGVSHRTIQSFESLVTGTSENIEALLTVYFRRMKPDTNREIIG